MIVRIAIGLAIAWMASDPRSVVAQQRYAAEGSHPLETVDPESEETAAFSLRLALTPTYAVVSEVPVYGMQLSLAMGKSYQPEGRTSSVCGVSSFAHGVTAEGLEFEHLTAGVRFELGWGRLRLGADLRIGLMPMRRASTNGVESSATFEAQAFTTLDIIEFGDHGGIYVIAQGSVGAAPHFGEGGLFSTGAGLGVRFE